LARTCTCTRSRSRQVKKKKKRRVEGRLLLLLLFCLEKKRKRVTAIVASGANVVATAPAAAEGNGRTDGRTEGSGKNTVHQGVLACKITLCSASKIPVCSEPSPSSSRIMVHEVHNTWVTQPANDVNRKFLDLGIHFALHINSRSSQGRNFFAQISSYVASEKIFIPAVVPDIHLGRRVGRSTSHSQRTKGVTSPGCMSPFGCSTASASMSACVPRNSSALDYDRSIWINILQAGLSPTCSYIEVSCTRKRRHKYGDIL
jgi:hypothetical protein